MEAEARALCTQAGGTFSVPGIEVLDEPTIFSCSDITRQLTSAEGLAVVAVCNDNAYGINVSLDSSGVTWGCARFLCADPLRQGRRAATG